MVIEINNLKTYTYEKILFTSLAVLGLGITGCSNEDLGVAKSGVDEVCATMGDAESRTAMNGNSVVWSTGDEIGIFVTNGSSSTYTNTNYSLSSGAGTKYAGFSGVLEGENPVKKAAFILMAAMLLMMEVKYH